LILSNLPNFLFAYFKLNKSQNFNSQIFLFIYNTKNKVRVFSNKSFYFKVIKLTWIKKSSLGQKKISLYSKSNSLIIIDHFIFFITALSNFLRYYNLYKSNSMFNYLNNTNLLVNNIHTDLFKSTKFYKINLRFDPFFNLFRFNNFVL
jgi:hypothetical protein